MRKRNHLSWIFTLFFVTGLLSSQASVEHYFLKVHRNGKTLEFRRENAKGHTLSKTSFEWSESPQKIAEKIASMGLFEKRLWVYFHCMWGNNGTFHRYTLRYIDEIVDNGRENILLSVIWPANKGGYQRNWKKAAETGQHLGNFFSCIAQYQKAGVNILCHSMGNRVFQGVWQQVGTQLKPENVILAAADLDADIFAGDFKNMNDLSQRILVVQHHNDRLLLASSLIWRKERLGRTSTITPAPGHMVVIDATPYISMRNVDLSNHMHFIFADSVRTRLHEIVR